MQRNEAINIIRQSWKQLYPADKSGKGIICPLCGNGSGETGDGIRENPRGKAGALHCFKCGFSGDVIDLIQQERGLSFPEALDAAAAELGIIIDSESSAGSYRAHQNATERPRIDFNAQQGENKPAAAPNQQSATESPQHDFRAYYAECVERLQAAPQAISYLQGRGISLETAARAGIGFDPEADPAGSGFTCPRIIIPTGRGHYVGRSIDPETAPKYRKLNSKDGSAGIFHERALYGDGLVFVTEGAFDALSVMELGAEAIALNSTSNANLLIDKLEKKPTGATLILCLDNDEAGANATEILQAGLTRLNISYVIASYKGKDPNEALTTNKEAFSAAIQKAQQEAARPDDVSAYIDGLMAGEISSFREAGEKKTGFPNLDAPEKAGGLYAGLYCIAAITSLGKTTFAAQIADQLATAGEHVLFFSMEQSRLEIVSKSIARRAAQKDAANAVSSLAIRRGYLPPQILDAADEYKADVAGRLSVIEGNFSCTTDYIAKYIRQYIQNNRVKPVVFVDYLQILQPEADARQQRREMVDTAITELKRISRELGLTVFIISSVNRSNYLTPIDFESLKESGGIEYTCDVVWGLQLQCLNDPIFTAEKKTTEKRERIREAKAEMPRKIQLVCLKNRYGISSYTADFEYFPQYDLFVPAQGQEPQQSKKRL